jgi:hypothetical protein
MLGLAVPAVGHATGSATPTVTPILLNWTPTGHSTLTWAGTETTGAYPEGQVTVSGGSGAPTGTATFTFFDAGGCSGTALLTETNPVSRYPTGSPGPLVPGNYSMQVQYNGDATYAPAAACTSFSVAQGDPFGRFNSSPAGQTLSLGSAPATLWIKPANASDAPSVAPTGTPTFGLYATGDCSGTAIASGSGWEWTPNVSLAAGPHSIKASYPADSNYVDPQLCIPFDVDRARPTFTAQILDAGTGKPWDDTEMPGAKARLRMNAQGGVGGFPLSSRALAVVHSDSWCNGPVVWSHSLTTGADGAADFGETSALPAGHYSYLTIFFGNANYYGNYAACENFDVRAVPKVVLPDNWASVTGLRTQSNGLVHVKIRVPGPGVVDVTENAGPRFVFARLRRTAERAGTITLTVRPTARGRRLIKHHRKAVRIHVWVSYTPTGGRLRAVGPFALRVK